MKLLTPFLICFAFVFFAPSLKAQRAETFFIKDSIGNLYPQSAFDSLSKVKSIILVPFKNRGIIEGYQITTAKVNAVPFTPKNKKYDIARVFTTDNPTLRIGGPMPPYKLMDLDGNVYHSDSMKGKVVVMNFWFKTCGPCKQEIPFLNGLVDYYANNSKVKFLAMGLDDSIACGIFLQRVPFQYQIVPEARDLANTWNISHYPTHIIIDKKGKIILYCEGYAPSIEYYLNEAIKSALSKP